jgi:hypothetical protein
MTDEENKMESGHDDIMPPTGSSGSSNTKWIAIIIVLVVIIAGLAVAYAIKPTTTTTTTTTTPTVSTTTTGQSYSFKVSNVPSFKYLNVYYGDGTSKNITSDPSNLSLQHTYNYPGSYIMYYTGRIYICKSNT